MGFETAPKRGVAVHYGPRNNVQKFGGAHGSKGRVKTAVWTLGPAELNADFATADLGADALALAIPAGAVILSAMLDVKVAFDGTSQACTIGLETAAGATIDADAIDAAVDLGTIGTIVCDGSSIGVSIGEDAGYLNVADVASDITVGEMDVIVEYVV